HRMSATDETHKSLRYKLGELLRDSTDHLLLLTATPHKGDPVNFTLFLQLLDADAYADVKSIRQAMTQQRAPFYLRRTKEAMVYFPERQPDGKWVARKIFTKRITRTVEFTLDCAEFDLYRAVTRFIKAQSAKAAAQGDDLRARGWFPDVAVSAAIGFEHLRPAPLIGEPRQTTRRRLEKRPATRRACTARGAERRRTRRNGRIRARPAGGNVGSGYARR
ncbi:MAG: hypothetical protein RMK20_13050, partial [Verrucomicrobiales bacterium]|nr:hypothetical protein [Verrucomicrobiales bacterium]